MNQSSKTDSQPFSKHSFNVVRQTDFSECILRFACRKILQSRGLKKHPCHAKPGNRMPLRQLLATRGTMHAPVEKKGNRYRANASTSKYRPLLVERIWLWVYSNKIPIHTIFYLLKGDCRSRLPTSCLCVF